MDLTALVSYLDGYLRVAEVPDAPHAVNGLQVANAGTVSRVAAAVDLCEATVRLAAVQGADLLLVHHGLFWGGLQPLTGRAHRRVSGLIRAPAGGTHGQRTAADGIRPRAGAPRGGRHRGGRIDDRAGRRR